MPEDVDKLEDPGFRVPEIVRENSILSSTSSRIDVIVVVGIDSNYTASSLLYKTITGSMFYRQRLIIKLLHILKDDSLHSFV